MKKLIAMLLVLVLSFALASCAAPQPGNTPTGGNNSSGENAPSGGEVQTEPQTHTHDWGDWIETVAPDCENEGVRTRTCIDDSSHREERVIPALGHEWLPATYTQPETCARCGKTNGEPASKSVAPTLDELQDMIASGNYVTKSDKNVSLQIPTSSQYLSKAYRAEVYNGKKTGRIFLIPAPEDDVYNHNGNLCAVDIKVQGWVVAKYGPFTFFVSDDGKMGWNGDVYFPAVN